MAVTPRQRRQFDLPRLIQLLHWKLHPLILPGAVLTRNTDMIGHRRRQSRDVTTGVIKYFLLCEQFLHRKRISDSSRGGSERHIGRSLADFDCQIDGTASTAVRQELRSA